MFRGFTRFEHRMAVALIVTLCAASVVYHWRTEREVTEQLLSGPVIDHPPGQLVLDAEALAAPTGDPTLEGVLVDGRVDVNRAPAELLASALPGIGPVRSEAIVAHRDREGGFASVEEMEAVSGIGPATVERLRPLVTFSPPAGAAGSAGEAAQIYAADEAAWLPQPAAPESQFININRATAEELEQLQGIGPALSLRIVEDRHLRGPFRTVEDLTRVSGIGPATLENNRHRLSVY